MPFKVTNVSYKLVILMCYFVSSWSILRQVPSRYEMSQQQQQRGGDPSVTSTIGSSSSSNSTAVTSRRARNQYAASLNATVSLGEMLGNPLEISNDLLVQQTRRSHLSSNSAAGGIEDNNNSVDVYHAATTFAQLHRV